MTKAEEQKLSEAVATVRQAIAQHKDSYLRIRFYESFGIEGDAERFTNNLETLRVTRKWEKLSEDLEKFFGDVMNASPRNTQP